MAEVQITPEFAVTGIRAIMREKAFAELEIDVALPRAADEWAARIRRGVDEVADEALNLMVAELSRLRTETGAPTSGGWSPMSDFDLAPFAPADFLLEDGKWVRGWSAPMRGAVKSTTIFWFWPTHDGEPCSTEEAEAGLRAHACQPMGWRKPRTWEAPFNGNYQEQK